MAEKVKRTRRGKKQLCLDFIGKRFAEAKSIDKALEKIEAILDGLQEELNQNKTNKKISVKRLVKGKSKEQIESLIAELQKQL